MIVRHPITLWNVLFSYRFSVLTRIWPRVLLTTGVSVAVTLTYLNGFRPDTLTVTPFSLIGVGLGIFLGFRTNSSYERFWEGRILWGRLVNCTRTITRQFELFAQGEETAEILEFRRRSARTLIAYVHSLRGMLRGQSVEDDLRRLVDSDVVDEVQGRRNPTNGLLQVLSGDTRGAWTRGWVNDFHLGRIDESMEELATIQGGCERISNTPFPFSYSFLIHRITAAYCLLLPFGIVDTVGPETPAVTFLISYAFLGLDAIGDEIEDPFGMEDNNLPLDTLSRNIEIDVLQMVDESDVPAPLEPKDRILT